MRKQPRPALLASAHDGDEASVRAMLADFCSRVTAGWEIDPAVLQYIAEQIDLQLVGHDRRHQLGYPRRGGGRPSKRDPGDYILAHHLLANDPAEGAKFRLAMAIADELDQNVQVTYACEHVAELNQLSVSAAKRAWARWGDDATLLTVSLSGVPGRVGADLKARYGRDRVEGRLAELGLLGRRSAWPRLQAWHRDNTPPEGWRA